MNHIMEAAINYASLGYAIFPCVPNSKVPITKAGFKDATTDTGQIEKWWSQYPKANLAIPTTDLIVIDVDGADNNYPGRDLFPGALSFTPHGGRHYIFKTPNGKRWHNTGGQLAPKVDTRAKGGYILVAPSLIDGKEYYWAETLELESSADKLIEPPSWLIKDLDYVKSEPIGSTLGETIPDGQRNSTLTSIAGTMRRIGMSESEIYSAIRTTNAERCVPPVNDSELRRIAKSVSRYEPDQISVALTEHHYEQDMETKLKVISDPGFLPERLLHVPGFISEIMDYCLSSAPYPSPVLAFCGAISLLSFLSARKIRDAGDNRTNLYLLGLAHSAAGKDFPRKINTKIIHAIGLEMGLGDRFASGEGIQDSLFISPSMLYQTDEIDGMLQTISKSKDGWHENIMGTLLTMYSSSNSIFPMRRKAGADHPGAIDQPSLTIFGTAIPTHYYAALSERMLTNGFFARMLVFESGKRGKGQEPTIQDIPNRIITTAASLRDFKTTGNLTSQHPQPKTLQYSDKARDVLIDVREQSEEEYEKVEQDGDSIGTTVWGRVSEQVRKLSLLHAISSDYRTSHIGHDSINWAFELMIHQTKRRLYMAQAHSSDNPFHAECLRLMQKLRDVKGDTMDHSSLLKRMKLDTQTFQRIIQTLTQQGDIDILKHDTQGRPKIVYKIK